MRNMHHYAVSQDPWPSHAEQKSDAPAHPVKASRMSALVTSFTAIVPARSICILFANLGMEITFSALA